MVTFKPNSELRSSAIVLSVLAIVVAILLFKDAPATVLSSLNEPYQGITAWMLLTSGMLQGIGALVPRRKLRQLGLTISSLAWFTLCGTLLSSWLMYSAIVGLVGLATFTALVKDVKGKPRDRCALT